MVATVTYCIAQEDESTAFKADQQVRSVEVKVNSAPSAQYATKRRQ
jgi:hypothetical protein